MVALTAKAILLMLPLTNPAPPSQPEDKNTRGRKDEQKAKWESREWWDVEQSGRIKSRLENEQGGNEERKSCGERRSAFDVSEVRQLKRQLAKTQHEQVFVLLFFFFCNVF